MSRAPKSRTTRLSARALCMAGAMLLAVAGAVTLNLQLVSGALALMFVLIVGTVLGGIATGELPFKGRMLVYDESPPAFIVALLSYVFLAAVMAYFGFELLLTG